MDTPFLTATSRSIDEDVPATRQCDGDGSNERVPFLDRSSAPATEITTSLTIRLYTSHLLSTWNSRLFEFGAVLFLAQRFPGSLLPLSIYALVRSAAAIVGAQTVGEAVDGAGERARRLSVVRVSIVAGRLAVVGSCVLWLLLGVQQHGNSDDGRMGRDAVTIGLFAGLVGLACVEKLCSIMNLVAVERDWVVVITEDNENARRTINAQMRRIDLVCKLLGPLAISCIAIASTTIAIWTTLAMNLASIVPEYLCIAQVYERVPALQLHGSESPESTDTTPTPGQKQSAIYRILPLKSLPFYIQHPAFLPSIALSLLYLTVLSLSGQMIAYLISVGYTTLHIGIVRTISTMFELSATWIAPQLMKRIGVVRCGIWSLSWQMIWLAAGAGCFFGQEKGSIMAATGLVVGVSFSRVGLWGYDLCAQSIIQDEVESDHRGSFSTVEAAFQNLFELASYLTTIIFSRPDQFQWPVVVSMAAVYLAGGLYAAFVRQRRGHLFHPPSCMCVEKGNRS